MPGMTGEPEPVPDADLVSGARSVGRSVVEHDALRAAAGLRTMGVGLGDPVAFLLRNDFVFFEATLAARALGAYAVPLNWHLAPAEIEHVLHDCGAKVLIAHADLLRRCAHILPPGITAMEPRTSSSSRWTSVAPAHPAPATLVRPARHCATRRAGA